MGAVLNVALSCSGIAERQAAGSQAGSQEGSSVHVFIHSIVAHKGYAGNDGNAHLLYVRYY